MTKLELLFDIESSKAKLKKLTYREEQIIPWNKHLKRMNEIYDNISFLNKKGIKVEKVCCTEFNKNDADNGFYPYLRLPQFLACMHPIFDDENYTFGFSLSGKLDGMCNSETFIKKITQYIN